MIRAAVRRGVFNLHDQDDVVQDILMSIHKSLPSYDSKRSPIPWVSTIIHRKVIDYIRKTTRNNEREILSDDGDVTFYPDQTNSNTEEDLKILESLPPEMKKIIEMTKIEGHTTSEVAQMLGIKENALRTRISRAMSSLKKKAGTFSE